MVNNIYQVLNISDDKASTVPNRPGPQAPAPVLDRAGDKWLVESSGEDGLSVHYQLWLVYSGGSGFRLMPPGPAREMCPHCRGRGAADRLSGDETAYESLECVWCCGESGRDRDSDFRLLINDGLGGRRVIRKRRAGRFNARQGLRGDLIICISWVDDLPAFAAGDPGQLEIRRPQAA